MPDEFREARAKALGRYQELVEIYRAECAAEGDKIRELGGLYVIGSERHESRRIDNQLRGRSGRQGDPGASRFYLSLDDELMRLFATGALSYVMNKALPEDEAIEAKMVTKAIERAQTTVETRNAEIRKNVLKYDEVMNEQRKVIYARRDQILEGADLKSAAMEYLNEAVDALLETYCASPAADEWDLDGLTKELKTFWPSTITEERLAECRNTKEMAALIDEDATAHYERREAELTPTVMREVERQVMLRIIDQRWREHLEEMDYLKEGINLRAMGQKDPLTEWQREGFEMFGSMMKGIAQDFVRYVMHVQVVRNEQPAQASAAPDAPVRRQPRQQPPLDPPRLVRWRRRSAISSRRRRTRIACRASPPPRQPPLPPSARWSRRPRPLGPPGPAVRKLPDANNRCRSRRRWSRTSGRRRPATPPARAARARSSSSATARASSPMRDFTDDLREQRRRLDEAAGYLDIAHARTRMSEVEAEMSRPDLWDDADYAKALNAEYANLRDDLATYDALEQSLSDAEVLHELAREEGDESQEPDIEAAISDVCASTRPARPAQPVHRSARRVRRDRADQRQGRWRRRPGLERDAPADVRALVGSPRVSRSRSTGSPRERKRASCRPRRRSRGATPTACSSVSGARTASCGSARSTTRAAVRRASLPCRCGR